MTYGLLDLLPEPIASALDAALDSCAKGRDRTADHRYYGLPVWVLTEHHNARTDKVEITALITGVQGPAISFAPDAYEDETENGFVISRRIASDDQVSKSTKWISLYRVLRHFEPPERAETKGWTELPVQWLADEIEQTMAQAHDLRLEEKVPIRRESFSGTDEG